MMMVFCQFRMIRSDWLPVGASSNRQEACQRLDPLLEITNQAPGKRPAAFNNRLNETKPVHRCPITGRRVQFRRPGKPPPDAPVRRACNEMERKNLRSSKVGMRLA